MIGILTAIKYNEDYKYSNSHYAIIYGISVEELNELEDEFVEGLEWEVWVNEEVFERYSSCLKRM